MARFDLGEVRTDSRDGPRQTREKRHGHEEATMVVELTEEQCAELQRLLEASLGDLSAEIADTDNAQYRDGLRQRRTVLESVLYQLDNPPRVEA
jgi:hypothetical protein